MFLKRVCSSYLLLALLSLGNSAWAKPRDPGQFNAEVGHTNGYGQANRTTAVPKISVLKSLRGLRPKEIDAASTAQFDKAKLDQYLNKKEAFLSKRETANKIVVDDQPVASTPSKENADPTIPTYSHCGYISPAAQVTSPYLQLVSSEDRQYLVKYLELTFSEVTSEADLKIVIGNEYSLVENFLTTYSPNLQERFIDWDGEGGKYSVQKKKVILGALAYSLSELAHRKMVLNHQILFNDNCQFVHNLVHEIDANKSAVTADSIGFKMMKFASGALK